MNIISQTIGNTICTWDESKPLAWKMDEPIGQKSDGRRLVYDFDLNSLGAFYPKSFLIDLRNVLISRRNIIALSTLETEFGYLRSLFKRMAVAELLTEQFERIDEAFLLALRTIVSDITGDTLGVLRRIFKHEPEAPIFAAGLMPNDFPSKSEVRGEFGELTSRILTRALTRAACVQILRTGEDLYEQGVLDIGQFSFLNLAFHIYCRPATYTKLTAADFRIDFNPETRVSSYFLFAVPVKSGVNTPDKICYQLTSIVGELIEKQRSHVISLYGRMLHKKDIGKLALFPSRMLNKEGNWVAKEARLNYGAATPANFSRAYMRQTQKKMASHGFTFNDLRHTVGTQLAQAGCSAKTIQAVLKHASHYTCQAYVDIVFHGLVEELSETLRPAFEEHFPAFGLFRSKNDPIAPEKAIRSGNLMDGRQDITGECGRRIACQYAPLSCYSCPRFIPCYDADHTINLDAVANEIHRYEASGRPFKQMLDKSKEIRTHINLVMAACLRKLESVDFEERQ